MDFTVYLLLLLLWDWTASGTARSKTNDLQLSSAMLLLAVPEAVSSHTRTGADISCAVNFLCCSSMSQRQSRPIQKRGKLVPPGPSFARNGCPDGIIRTSKYLLTATSSYACFFSTNNSIYLVFN